jgi:hypothetical protein
MKRRGVAAPGLLRAGERQAKREGGRSFYF